MSNTATQSNVIQVKDQEHFHELRSKGIGASDISAVIGVNKYKTPYQLWREKTGKDEGFKGNELTESGTRIEPVVAEYFEDRSGHRVIKRTSDEYLVVHPVHDFIRCHPDREYFDKNIGGRGTLECKTKYFEKPEKGSLPEEWFCQNQYQIGTNQQKKGAIAWIAFSFGVEFDYEEFDLDNQFYDYLVNEAGAFWNNHVLKDIPPPAVNANDVLIAFPEHITGKRITASEELYNTYKALHEVKERISMLKSDEEHYKEAIQLVMQDAESVVYGDKTLITWKKSKDSVMVDTAKLKADKELFAKYSKVRTGGRMFLVK